MMISGKRLKERNADEGPRFLVQKMRVWIRLTEKELKLKLAKRLTELAPGIEADVGTDSGGEYDFIINDGDLKAVFPVSEALDRMEGEYFQATGKRLQRSNKGPGGLFIFTSPTGGSGLTSVAFTFARHMAGKLSGRVLFVDTDSLGPMEYLESVRGRGDRSAELEYRIKAGMACDVNSYLSKDRYGPYVISLRDPDEALVIAVLEGSGCEYAVVSGKRVSLKGTARIQVINAQDKRQPEDQGETDVRVFNNGATIPRDPDSFTGDGRSVRIDMSGDFAMAVGKLFREVMDGYGYGRTQENGA